MDKPCDICGGVGNAELILTCSKCCTACEHVYCKRVFSMEIPEVWVCEACLSDKGISSPKCGGEEEFLDSLGVVHHDVAHSGPPDRACAVQGWRVGSKKLKIGTGKVKFLDAEEVIRLSSGTLKMESTRHNNHGLKYGMSSSATPMSGKTSVPSIIVTPKFSCLRGKANPNVMSSGFRKPPSDGGAIINAIIGQHAVKTSKEDHSAKEWQRSVFMPAKEEKISKIKTKEVDMANSNSETKMYTASYASSTTIHAIPTKQVETSSRITNKPSQTPPFKVSAVTSSGKTFHAGVYPQNFSVERQDLLNIQSKFKLYHPYLPTLEATWTGGFFLDTTAGSNFYGWYQAQPSCRVRRKVLELSKKLPFRLQAKLLPQSYLWNDLFGSGCPDFQDIALYFFPSANIERSKANNSSLVELLEIQNLVMRSYLDGVELLIFTSKQLHVDCQRIIARMNTEYFLWGVFRNVKSDHAMMDNDEAIDMDIDMEGGRIVGPVDIVVSKALSGRECRSHDKRDVNPATENMLVEPKEGGCTSSNSFIKYSEKISSKISSKHSLEISKWKLENVKNEAQFPPGFKEIPKLKSRIIEEKAGAVDGGVINHVKNKNLGLRDWGGTSKASSPQPQHHQETARDQVCDLLAVIAPYLSEKDNKDGSKIKAGENDDDNPHRTCEKEDLEAEDRSKMNISICWRPPPKGWVKLNVEGSSNEVLGYAGAGGIVRNESGKWLLGYSKNLGTSRSLGSELWALHLGLKLLWERGFRKVLVETVSQEAVKCLKQPVAFLDPNRSLIQSCRDLLNRNWECRVQHIHREANLSASCLATHIEYQPLGSVAIFDSPPQPMVPIFQKDSTGFVKTHSWKSPDAPVAQSEDLK